MKKRYKKKYRSLFREMLLSLLYQWDFLKDVYTPDEVVEKFIKNKKNRFYKALKERFKEIIDLYDEIDVLIEKYSNWSFDKMDNIDKNIIRIAIFEMLYKDIPPEISISEAIKLSDKYSTNVSYKLINGILGRIKDELLQPAGKDSNNRQT